MLAQNQTIQQILGLSKYLQYFVRNQASHTLPDPRSETSRISID